MADAPKRGSFKEMMARAALAPKPALPPGTIVDKRSKPVRRGAAPPGVDRNGRVSKAPLKNGPARHAGTSIGRASTLQTHNSASNNRLKATKMSSKEQRALLIQEKKRAMIAARNATAPVYTGTGRKPVGFTQSKTTVSGMRAALNQSSKSRHNGPKGRQTQGDEYLETDEEDDGGEDNGRYDDESDDMEAGGFEALEEEERRSAAIARREDKLAEQEEAAHRAEKAEKKRKLVRGGR